MPRHNTPRCVPTISLASCSTLANFTSRGCANHKNSLYGEPLGTSVSDKMLACVPVSSRSTMEVSSSGTRKYTLTHTSTVDSNGICAASQGANQRPLSNSRRIRSCRQICPTSRGAGLKGVSSPPTTHPHAYALCPQTTLNGPTPCGHYLIRWAARMSGEGRAAPNSPFLLYLSRSSRILNLPTPQCSAPSARRNLPSRRRAPSTYMTTAQAREATTSRRRWAMGRHKEARGQIYRTDGNSP